MTTQQKAVAWIGLGLMLIGLGTVSVYVYNKSQEKK